MTETRHKQVRVRNDSTENVLLKARIRHTRIFCLLLAPLLAVTSPWWPESSLPHEVMEFWGHLFVPGGVLIRVFSSLYIGGRKNEAVVSDGPFSVVRNPLYVGSFLATTGLALLTGSLALTALLTAAFCAYYRVTVGREEVFLHRKFGARYRRYAARVPRWVPEPKLWQSPGEITVRPHFVLKAVLDGSVFLLLVPLLEVLRELRDLGVVPTLMTLP